MKEVKICYSDKRNIGDAINPYIVREVLHFEPILTDANKCTITGIGSGLRRFFVHPNSARSLIELFANKLLNNHPLVIWSAGFISTPTCSEFVTRKNIKVASVRGELSRQYIEKILKHPIECTTGDGGLLCSRWIPPVEKKMYRLGIIPHIKEKDEKFFDDLHRSIDDSVIIDVEDNPIKVLNTISSCECIISSSLHGLIISDSYCVPNKHVILTDKLSGDGFKFHDYYSSFGLEDNPIDLRIRSNIDVNSIVNDYYITKEMVTDKQREIITAFSKYL